MDLDLYSELRIIDRSILPDANKILGNEISWCLLSLNSSAISILENNLDKVDWKYLSLNHNAVHLLENNLDKVDWKYLSLNHNAVHLLEKNIDKIDWKYLSLNHNAIHLLEKNLDKIDWTKLSKNINAIHLLEKNLDKVDWKYLALNHNGIHLLEKNIDNIDINSYCQPLRSLQDHKILKNISLEKFNTIFFERSGYANDHNIYCKISNFKYINIEQFNEIFKNRNIFNHRKDLFDYCDALIGNEDPDIIKILEKYMDKFIDNNCFLDWFLLKNNLNGLRFLEKNLDKLYITDHQWIELSSKPNAIHLLEKNLHKVNWYWLSMNHNAIHILEKKINAEKLIKKNTIHLMLKEQFDNIYKRIDKIESELLSILNIDINNKCKLEKNLSNNLLLENRIDKIDIELYIHNMNINNILEKKNKRNIIYDLSVFLLFCIFIFINFYINKLIKIN